MKLSIKNSTDEERSFVVKVIISGTARFINTKITNNAIVATFESVYKVFILRSFLVRVTRIIRTSFLATNIRHQFVKRLDSINLARTTSRKAPKIKAPGLVRIILVTLFIISNYPSAHAPRGRGSSVQFRYCQPFVSFFLEEFIDHIRKIHRVIILDRFYIVIRQNAFGIRIRK